MAQTVADHSSLDRGYAWIVTIAVFNSNLLVAGYFRSFSVFFLEIVDTFHTSYTLASVIMGVQGAVCCVTVLLVHKVLLERLGTRPVAMFGGLVFSCGVFLVYFAQSPLFLIFTLGVLVGMGTGAVYSPGTVLLGQYFEKRRALATSLACVGSSVGSMTLPVLATELILLYGLKGACLLFGGLTLHLCVTSALYRPAPAAVTDSSVASSEWESTLLSVTTSSSCEEEEKPGCDSVPHSSEPHLPLETHSLKGDSEAERVHVGAKQPLLVPFVKLDREFLYPSVDSEVNDLGLDLRVNDERKKFVSCKEGVLIKDHDIEMLNNRWLLLPVPKIAKSKVCVSVQDLFAYRDPFLTHSNLKRRDSFHSLTFQNCSGAFEEQSQSCKLSQVLDTVETVSMFASQFHLPVMPSLLTEVDKIVAAEDATEEGEDPSDGVKDKPATCLKQALSSCISCDRRLARNPLFWLLQVYSALGFLSSQAPFVYIPSLLQGKGMSREDVAVALTVWGACSLVGRLLCGVVTDRQILRPVTLSALGFLLLGALFFLVPALPDGMEVWMAFTVAYGLLEGLYHCLMPVIVIDLLTIQHFSSALGMSQISQSMGVTLLFPVLGYLRDSTGDYNATFYFLAVCAVLVAIMLTVYTVYTALTPHRTLPDS